MRQRIKSTFEKWKQAASSLKIETQALYLAYKHPQTPWYAKVFAGLVVAFAFSPIDLVPDFVPILGYLDDLILVPLGITFALKMIPTSVMDECRAQVKIDMLEEKPVNWLGVIIIAALWLGLFALCMSWVVKHLR